MLKQFLVFLTFAFVSLGYSQPVFLNPLSSYGIGNQIQKTDAIQASMGGTYIAFSDSTLISYLNSANTASLTSSYPLFSVGLSGNYTQFTEGNLKYNRGFAALEHLIFAVPFRERYGLSFGLSPFSRRGYQFQNKTLVGTDSMTFLYTGTGTISKAFTGLSFKLINHPQHQLSFGSNVGYLFGSTINSRSSTIDNTSIDGLALQTDRLQSLHYDFSLQYGYKWVRNDTIQYTKGNETLIKINQRNHQIKVIGYYEPTQKLTGRFSDELFQVVGSATTAIISSLSTDATYINGSSLKIGGMYATTFSRLSKKNKTFTSELTFVGEFNKSLFSDFRKDYNAQALSAYTSDFTRISGGVQYTPSVNYYQKLEAAGIWAKLKYRAGVYTSTLPYTFNNESFKEFGTTFGIGIPMFLPTNAYSSINIGIEAGKRSNNAAGAINEKYLGVNIGIVIAPGRGDQWFRKVKLD